MDSNCCSQPKHSLPRASASYSSVPSHHRHRHCVVPSANARLSTEAYCLPKFEEGNDDSSSKATPTELFSACNLKEMQTAEVVESEYQPGMLELEDG
jgi:hypothetical protein